MAVTHCKNNQFDQPRKTPVAESGGEDACGPAAYYPIFVSLRGKTCLVVGGGSVGERKVKGLLAHGAAVKITAAELTPWLDQQNELGNLIWLGPAYEPWHLEKVQLVFAATSGRELNRAIAADAEARGIWCNMAAEPELGSFHVPAVFRRGPLGIAVSTSGFSPAFATRIRDKIAQQFGMEWAAALKLLGSLRTAIQAKGLSTQENQSLFKQIASLPLTDWILTRDEEQMVQNIHGICKRWLSEEELRRVLASLW